MSSQISPQEFAEMALNTVEDYCRKYASEREEYPLSYTNCIVASTPDSLEILLENNEDLQEIWKNADSTFKKSAKKEYEKLWTEASVVALSQELDDLLKEGFTRLYEFEPIFIDKYGFLHREDVDDATLIKYRIKLLEKYKKFLDELGDAIAKALDKQEPLSPNKLRDYLLYFYYTVGIDYQGFLDPIEDYVDDYHILNEDGRLEVLSELTFSISNVLDEIESAIKEYKEWLEKHALEQ